MPSVGLEPRGAPKRANNRYLEQTKAVGRSMAGGRAHAWRFAHARLDRSANLDCLLFVCDQFLIRISQNDEKARRIELAHNRRRALYLASLLTLA